MFVANLTPMAIGLLLLLGSMAVSAGITILVVVLLDRHQERVLVEEYTASLEAFLDEMEARLTDDSLAPAADGSQDEGEDFAEWEVRSVEEADDADYFDYVAAKIERTSTLVETTLDYMDLLEVHPDCVGADSIPMLAAMVDALVEEEYDLRNELYFA
ncbi:MAG: hypothetical protein ACOX2R_00540 [Anaerolineae bacterium]|jgi:hypothetical protein